MKIGVDFHVLQNLYQGSRRHLEGLYRALTEIDKLNDYIFFVNKPAELNKEWEKRGKIVGFGTSSKFKRLTYTVPLLVRRENLDIFHFQYISPLLCKCPVLLTVHDILFNTHPQYFKKSFVVRSKILIARSIKKAHHIFTVSSYSKNKIQEFYNVNDQQISVTPNAVDFKIFNPEQRQESKKLILKKWGVQDFILTVGRLEPRKNHVKLIEAYKILYENNKNIPYLVIVGQRHFHYYEIFKKIAENNLEDKVRIIEDVNDKWLPHFYRASLLFVYPSFAEGFGIPPLEAMACGQPVICSNTTSMPEVVGDAALTIDPHNEEDIADKIKYIMQNSLVRNELSKKALEQAKKFNWYRSAQTVLNVLEKPF